MGSLPNADYFREAAARQVAGPEEQLQPEEEEEEEESENDEENEQREGVEMGQIKGIIRRSRNKGEEEAIDEEKRRRIRLDMLTILAALALQDLPFFCLRLTLIFRFRVISHMNIFFTCKNGEKHFFQSMIELIM